MESSWHRAWHAVGMKATLAAVIIVCGHSPLLRTLPTGQASPWFCALGSFLPLSAGPLPDSFPGPRPAALPVIAVLTARGLPG